VGTIARTLGGAVGRRVGCARLLRRRFVTGGGAVVTRLGGVRTRLLPGSTLLPVVTPVPLSVGLLTSETSVDPDLGVESCVARVDSAASVDDVGVLADADDASFVVSAVPSGFCADVSVVLPSVAESAEVDVLAGMFAAVLPVVRVAILDAGPGSAAGPGGVAVAVGVMAFAMTWTKFTRGPMAPGPVPGMWRLVPKMGKPMSRALKIETPGLSRPPKASTTVVPADKGVNPNAGPIADNTG